MAGAAVHDGFDRLTLGFQALFERLWEDSLMPKVTPFPQTLHLPLPHLAYQNNG